MAHPCDPLRHNVQLEDLSIHLTSEDAAHRTVTSHTQMAAQQPTHHVCVDVAIVMGAWLHDFIAELAGRPVKHMPVAEDAGRAAGVKDDRPKRSGGSVDMADADARHDSVQAT